MVRCVYIDELLSYYLVLLVICSILSRQMWALEFHWLIQNDSSSKQKCMEAKNDDKTLNQTSILSPINELDEILMKRGIHFCLQDYFNHSLFAKQQRSNWVEQCRQYNTSKEYNTNEQRIQYKRIQRRNNTIQYKQRIQHKRTKTLQYKEYNTIQKNTIQTNKKYNTIPTKNITLQRI